MITDQLFWEWFVERIRAVVARPTEFFAEIKDEIKEEAKNKAEKKQTKVYFLLFAAVLSCFLVIQKLKLATIFQDWKFALYLLPFTILVMLGMIILWLFQAAMAYLFLRLLNGKGSYTNTLLVTVYSATPFFIFMILFSLLNIILVELQAFSLIIQVIMFFLSMITFFYQWWLTLIGYSAMHDISKLRAFAAAYIIPYLILGICLTVLMTVVYLNAPIDPIGGLAKWG